MKPIPTFIATCMLFSGHAVSAQEPPMVESHPLDISRSPGLREPGHIKSSVAPETTELTATLHEDGRVVIDCRQRHAHPHQPPRINPAEKPR